MPEKSSENYFADMQRQLLNSGVSPKYVRRTISELNDHLEDIQCEASNNSISRAEAAHRLGNLQVIAQEILARKELRTWIYRYPRVARVYMPVAWVLLLPAAPIIAGVANPSLIVRWSKALLLSAAVTAAMLRLMELSIAVT